MASSCVLARSRLIARVISSLHDQELRPFGLNSSQFALLLFMSTIQPATRAEIGRRFYQDRSTLTRNLKVMIGEGWIEEDQAATKGRARPMRLSDAGVDLLIRAKPAWEAGQEKSRTILGSDGTKVVMETANRLLASAAK